MSQGLWSSCQYPLINYLRLVGGLNSVAFNRGMRLSSRGIPHGGRGIPERGLGIGLDDLECVIFSNGYPACSAGGGGGCILFTTGVSRGGCGGF